MKPRIVILYIILLAGGLWNALGLLQDEMRMLASPLIIGLGIWTFIEAMLNFRRVESRPPRNFIIWTLFVVIASFAAEVLGVHTGVLFGEYSYGDTLQPQLFEVPIAIGFAWFTMMLASAAVVLGLGRGGQGSAPRVLALAMAFVMAGFDSLMEPAATALGYWTWAGGTVPMLNFLTWFLLSYIFALVGLSTHALPRKEFRFGLHVFLAQAGYFVLTSLGEYIRTL